MSNTKFTPGPWKWQGEDYRGGWGWQLLVGSKGEGIICGSNHDGKRETPYKNLRAYIPIDPKYCKTGFLSSDESAPPIHVLEADAALIVCAPDMYESIRQTVNWLNNQICEASCSDFKHINKDEIEIHAKALENVLAKARGETK